MDDLSLDGKMERVESLVTGLERCPDPNVRDQARELVATLMDFHAAGLSRIVEKIVGAVPDAAGLLAELGKDPVAGSLLLLHGLHPADVGRRVTEALAEVRPELHSHHGDVELVSIEAGTVHLKLIGACHGCPSSAETLRKLITGAIHQRAPEIDSVEVQGMVSA